MITRIPKRKGSGTPPINTAELVGDIVEILFAMVGRLGEHWEGCAADCGLSSAQAAAIQQMEDPLTMRELADRLGCDPSNITGIIDRLAVRDLVERQPDPGDRRIKRLVLTAEGHRLRLRLHQRLLSQPAPLTGLSPDEQRTLRDLLIRALPPESAPEH